MENKYFECVKCGLCCKTASVAVLTLIGLPVHGSGAGCGNLKDDNSCGIYESRPAICRVDKVHSMAYGSVSWDDFKKMSNKACIELQTKYGWKGN